MSINQIGNLPLFALSIYLLLCFRISENNACEIPPVSYQHPVQKFFHLFALFLKREYGMEEDGQEQTEGQAWAGVDIKRGVANLYGGW